MKINFAPDWTEWEQTRKKGFVRFVCVYGILYWGVTAGVLFSLVISLLPSVKFDQVWRVAIPTFAIGGLFWGIAVWLVLLWRHPQRRVSPATIFKE